jgi:hypothetical protein
MADAESRIQGNIQTHDLNNAGDWALVALADLPDAAPGLAENVR